MDPFCPLRRRRQSPHSGLESLDSERLYQLKALQDKIQVSFLDLTLLDEASTHRSFANESNFRVSDNERLEFLGDSVLGFISAELLYTQYQHIPEGTLAKLKSKIVSGPVLTGICKDLDLVRFLRFGKGEKETGLTNRRVMENMIEALLGAIYLDQGMDACKKFIVPHLKNYLGQLEDLESVKDYKSILQELSQKKYKKVPQYELVSSEGPDHDKLFIVRVVLPNGFSLTGEGKNKRSAEHSAAKKIVGEWKKS